MNHGRSNGSSQHRAAPPVERGHRAPRRRLAPNLVALAACCSASLLFAAPAHADVDCESLPNIALGVGGSAQKPLLKRLAKILASQPSPSTLIYAAPGACNGVYALADDTAFSGNASYWDAAGTELTCTVNAPGRLTDFAVMGNSAELCSDLTALPENIGDFLGPVGTVNVFVPLASPETSISSEAFYFVYGFGASGRAAPWTNQDLIIRRDANSFVQLFLSLASGVPASRFAGVDARNNANSVSLVADAADPAAAIGFASGEVADAARDRVKTLAWQQQGQSCGYWPDSTPTAIDKANVRSGQYYLWGPVHFFARVDTSGVVENPVARQFIGWATGDVAPPAGVDIVREVTTNGNVPQCAMRVGRDGDLGPIYSNAPDEPCGCYYESLTGGTDCTPCTADSDCSATAGVCRYGYCEVR